jgi:hypothetical protein
MVARMSMQALDQQDAHKQRRRRSPNPHTRGKALLANLDWRSREAKVLVAARRELTAHVGGSPNSVQRVLIERASRLMLYLEMMDAKAFEAGSLTEHDSRVYLAWVGALRLCLREIGIDEAPSAKGEATLADYVKAAAR